MIESFCGFDEEDKKSRDEESTRLGAFGSGLLAGMTMPPGKFCDAENRLFSLSFANAESERPCKRSALRFVINAGDLI